MFESRHLNVSGKPLLAVLFDPSRVMRALVEGKRRYYQPIVDFLKGRPLPLFRHEHRARAGLQAVQDPLCSIRQALLHRHHNPAGNHSFAYAIKDTVVEWLDPKPAT